MALLRIAVHAGDHAVRDPRLLRALLIIRARYVDPTLSLPIVSRQSGISPWQLSRLMTRCMGRGFMSHVHATRVRAAERLLLETPLSVKEIAAAVGYRSTTQLDRQFKRAGGGTPSTLRRQMIGAPSSEPAAITVD
jgi:transcriptional regulator GlxA family with amidase domain